MPLDFPEHGDDGPVRRLLDDFPATGEFGCLLRQALCQRALDDMATVEGDLERELQQLDSVDGRIARINAEHQLRMEYLIHFGVAPDERHEFASLLNESAQHGGLTPQEAARLAHARQRLILDQRNGSSRGSGSTSITSSSAAA